jgi:UDP-N-acetyl-D-mannosaminuronic acid transferase (WecB/TagA/CpsF family)
MASRSAGTVLRQRIPERVAGADSCRSSRPCCPTGASFFFLGGEDGAVEAAAQSWRLPSGLRIAGVYEPPRASLEAMDNAEILRRLDDEA